MRLVIVRAGASGLRLIGCAHDSFLIEDTIEEIEGSVAKLQAIMRAGVARPAGRLRVARRLQARRDIVRYPDRFIDKRELEDGMRHWNRLMTLIRRRRKMDSLQITDKEALSRTPADPGEAEAEEQAAFQGAVGQVARAVG